MKAERIRRASIPKGIAMILALGVSAPAFSQEGSIDLGKFDCGVIRKDGRTLELDRRTTSGPVTTTFTCEGRSCVNRERIHTTDGSVSVVFRQIYIPRDRAEYGSTWAIWKEAAVEPSVHRSKVYPFVNY